MSVKYDSDIFYEEVNLLAMEEMTRLKDLKSNCYSCTAEVNRNLDKIEEYNTYILDCNNLIDKYRTQLAENQKKVIIARDRLYTELSRNMFKQVESIENPVVAEVDLGRTE